jgi:hypothetical protein
MNPHADREESSAPPAWHEPGRGRRSVIWARRIFKYAIIGYLLYRISGIGWQEVLRSLPTTPLFYLIGLLFFLALPVSEVFIYGQLFRVPPWQGFWTFLRKRTYNNEVLGYSGEVFLYLWGWKDIGNDERQVFHAVKANNIVSGFCSTLWALIVLGVVFATGSLPALQDKVQSLGSYLVGGIAVMFCVTAILILFRRHLLGIAPGKTILIGGLHLGRLTVVACLRVLQWASVLPGVPLESWVGLLALEVIVTRLPFLPGRDLIFAGAIVDLAPAFGVPATPMLAMLVAHGALERLMNLVVMVIPVGRSQKEASGAHS